MPVHMCVCGVWCVVCGEAAGVVCVAHVFTHRYREFALQRVLNHLDYYNPNLFSTSCLLN